MKQSNASGILRLTLLAAIACAPALASGESDEELAKKLANPVAPMISVPIQLNYDERYGAARDGDKLYANLQPVIPFRLNSDWIVISRTILPFVSQDGVAPGGGSQSGIGDITQSLFFLPAESTSDLKWGLGPVFLLPTGSDDRLSARKWGFGPTGVIVKQYGAWTYGVLANHLWGAGGDGDHPDLSTTFFQPFLSHTSRTAWTLGVNAETSYDWKGGQWSVPLNLSVSKLLTFGTQRVSVGAGLRYWLDGPTSGPHDLGYRLVVTFLIPE